MHHGCFWVTFVALILSVSSGRVPRKAKNSISRECSVVYDVQSASLSVKDGVVVPHVAKAWFKNAVNETGWAYLHVSTNSSFDDLLQAEAAGMVEGYMTADFISMAFQNTQADYCVGEEEYCDRLKKFVTANRDWIAAQVKVNEKSSYWHQVDLLYRQVQGLVTGYGLSRMAPEMGEWEFTLIQMSGDLLDLERILHRKKTRNVMDPGHCSGLVKLLPGSKDLLISHTTWFLYSQMLRVYKLYSFGYRQNTQGQAIVSSSEISFSSYPGMVNSMDDFYILSSGMVAQETTIDNNNPALDELVNPSTVMCWARVMIANRLADSGNEWVSLFERFNSGTYNNQWMVLDYKLFEPGRPLKPDTLWILEQLPGTVEMADMTLVLESQGYWPSYNLAYFEHIYNASGMPKLRKELGDFWDYNLNPRAQIFRRDQAKVVDMPSFVKLMRYNDYLHDPLSKCNCTPPYTASNAIAMRGDLNSVNGTYPMPVFGYSLSGAYDCKATSSQMAKWMSQVVASGPTWDDVPPFRWSDTGKAKPLGHPDVWKFEPFTFEWNVTMSSIV